MDSRKTDINEDTIQELSRMAYRRRKAAEVDVDRELADFWQAQGMDVSVPGKKKGTYRAWQVWTAMLMGAAAMFAGFMFYLHLADNDSTIVALQFDKTPQRVMLNAGDRILDISTMDSLNLQERKTLLHGSAERHPETNDSVSMHYLSTPRGMDFKLTLLDGTEVWLDAESTIEFPTSFAGSERRVNICGKAYFRVAHNEKQPFIVSVDGKQVRVLGTEFNVVNYAADSTQVTLVKGSIELCSPDSSSDGLVELKPGQEAVWSENGDMKVHEVDTYPVTQWVNGLFYFNEQPLGSILKELGRWYNKGVQFRVGKHQNYKIHFSASRTDDLQDIIEDLNLFCPFKIVIENNNIIVN